MRVPDSLEAVERLFYGRGWTDGLPIVPPTRERILRMLGGTRFAPDRLIGAVAPKWGAATVEKLAINAVMAGCLPEYMPVIITAMQAMTDPHFNLYTMQATTHPVAPLLIVNGPIAKKLDINSGYGLFGPGTKANATIGRAIRLILINVGGALPGRLDRATQGHPSKYTYCIAENEDETPWEPLHVERGFARDQSVVTVCPCESPHNINDHEAVSALGVLTTFASAMSAMGSNNAKIIEGEPVVAFGPEHAATVARDGYSKADVKKFLFEKARIPYSKLSAEAIAIRRGDPARYGVFDENTEFPVVRRAEDFIVIVAGGAGKHSSYIPTNASSFPVTKAIEQ
ncbi:MAG: hypothetical protein HYX92_10810 [Chloroflexi bacterium]|nr:hypothetical protein [Chloroflexota bacterium]